jgi:hypothetical protein
MTAVRWERYPLVASMPTAQAWLQIQADLGLASNTSRPTDGLSRTTCSFSDQSGVTPEAAKGAHVRLRPGSHQPV